MKLAMLGDLALLGRFCLERNPKVLHSLESLRTFLSGYDAVIANLETPLCDYTKPHGAKSAHIRAATQNVEILTFLGITHVSLANNHMGDYGQIGYEETKSVIERAGIAWFGAEGRQVYISYSDARIALMGYCAFNTNPLFITQGSTPGVHVLDLYRVFFEMSANVKNGYLNVISVHSGQEHVPMPSLADILFARGLARRFNYVYYGHHPHVIQGVEQVEGSPIFYSLGNFLFDDVYTPRDPEKPLIALSEANKTGLIATIEVSGTTVSGWYVTPLYLGREHVLIGDDVPDFDMVEINAHLTRALMPNYSEDRQMLIKDYLNSRRSNRNLKWYLRRLNSNSIGIILGALKNSRAQRRYFESRLPNLFRNF